MEGDGEGGRWGGRGRDVAWVRGKEEVEKEGGEEEWGKGMLRWNIFLCRKKSFRRSRKVYCPQDPLLEEKKVRVVVMKIT